MARRDQRSPEAARYRRWYNLAAWARARRGCLQANPLCERCKAQGFVVAATVVNHRVPHKGSWSLFIDPHNHQSVCDPCHDGPIQSEERTGRAKPSAGYSAQVGDDGQPTDPRHPFFAG
jgi:5-methylcytosine-specific restriction protein A